MRSTIKTLVLVSGLSLSVVTMAQSLSLNEYYSDYLSIENSNVAAAEYHADSVALADKISLAQYYAEYCTGNSVPVQVVSTSSKTRVYTSNSCENHYAEYLK